MEEFGDDGALSSQRVCMPNSQPMTISPQDFTVYGKIKEDREKQQKEAHPGSKIVYSQGPQYVCISDSQDNLDNKENAKEMTLQTLTEQDSLDGTFKAQPAN